MKLTYSEINALFLALNELRGASIAVDLGNDKSEIIREPYPLSEKAKWNAAKNRDILKRYVRAHEEIVQDEMATLNVFKKEQQRTYINEEDPVIKAQKTKTAGMAIQDRVDELNEKLRATDNRVEEVDNLLFIPAKGLCLKSSKIPPTLVSELMPLIDGEPEFEPEPVSKSK